MPSLDLLWKTLNSNFAILVLGSGFSWVFVHFIWEPWVNRKDARERQVRFRQEAEFRLVSVKEQLGKSTTIYDVDGGGLASCIDPMFSHWKLCGLIFSGWDRQIYKRASPLINAIRLYGNDTDDIPAARNALSQLYEILDLKD